MLETIATTTAPTLKEIASAQGHQILIVHSLLTGAAAMLDAAGQIEIQMVVDVALERLDAIHTALAPHI
jgi:hypothetical protein